jgi:hypothetical protein
LACGFSGGFFEVCGPWQEDVVADVGEGGVGEAFGVGPVVVEVESGAVVDEVELTVPVEEIGVAGSAVDVEGEGVEPDGERGDLRISSITGCGVEHSGAGEIVESEVEACAGAEKVANLLVGLVAPEGRVDLSEDEFGDFETKCATNFACDEFRYQGERALASAAELNDVEAQIIRFNNCWKGAAFTKSSYVLGGADGAKHWCLV